jgi:hypothetical protein
MPLFDPLTTRLLNEAIGPTTPTGPKRISKLVKAPSGGMGGGGPAIDKTKRARYTGSWTGTPEAPGTKMPSGAGIMTQTAWGNYKKTVDPLVDYYMDMLPVVGKDPVLRYGAKQLIKTDLALKYLGAGGIASATGKKLASTLGVDTSGAESVLGNIASSIPGAGTLMGAAGTPTGRFGILGTKVAQKIPELALMGIDPLDWATKAFGADAAAEHISNIPRQTMAVTSAGGYLQKGKQRGIY